MILCVDFRNATSEAIAAFATFLHSKVCIARLSEKAPGLTGYHAWLLTEENDLHSGHVVLDFSGTPSQLKALRLT